MTGIGSMGLYRNVDRVLADLAALGFGPDDPLTVDDLTAFDQFHYEGTDAVDEAIKLLGPGPSTHILDVGSGLGGPARYIADRTGSKVTALELQDELNLAAASLTERCGLGEQVVHRHGDMLAGDAGVGSFDGLVSMLCILHIADRATLFRNCAQALRPGGIVVIDDYVERAPFTNEERQQLAQTVFCSYLPNETTYQAHLEAAGFVDVTIHDKTAEWTTFVIDRLEAFRRARTELCVRYGDETVAGLDHFYGTVAALFEDGNLGGIRLTARLPGA